MARRYADPLYPTEGFLQRHPAFVSIAVTVVTLLLFFLDLVTYLAMAAPVAVLVGHLVGLVLTLTAIWLRRRWPVLLLLGLAVAMPLLRLATSGLMRELPFTDMSLEPEPTADSLNAWYGAPTLTFGTGLAGLLLLGTVAQSKNARVTWCTFLAVVAIDTIGHMVWVPASDIGFSLVPNVLVMIVIVLTGINLRVRRLRMQDLADRNRQLVLERDMLEQLAVTAERARIAREMHDVVAHSLSVMITLTEGSSAILHKNPERAQQALEEVTRVGRSALADTRRLVGVLRDGTPAPSEGNGETGRPAGTEPVPLTPQPTAHDLPELVERFRAAGLPVEYRYLGAALPEDAFLHLTVFRIVQEGLTNVLRHAPGSRRITVSVIRQAQTVTISVDNETGADGSTITGSRRGLIGIRERAAAFDGTVDAGPTPSGWLLQVLLRLA